MNAVHLCVPVLRRYDLLKNCIESALAGTVKPDKVWIIDNGQQTVANPTLTFDAHVSWLIPSRNLGVAASWNWFIDNVPEERIISNDDVLFAPESIERIVATKGAFVSPLAKENIAFSCFLIRDECVAKVGKFDETISPGYAYWEDVDYAWRMDAAGLDITGVECGVTHVGSASLVEDVEHHRKFMIAQNNFLKKHGCLPQDRVRQRFGEKP